MTRIQLFQQLESVLLRRREALRRSLSDELAHFNTSEERIVGDQADSALDADYGFINSQLAETESRELALIEHALERMGEGRYGDCEECGKKIPTARLQALPYATTCIDCQRASERGDAEHGPRWSSIGSDEQHARRRSPGVTSLVA